MQIRRAELCDTDGINTLLYQVLTVHHNGRPDLFKANAKKYTDDELMSIIADDNAPIFVAVNNGDIVGYAFCIFKQFSEDNILTDVKTLYIDDLCVSENCRRMGIGKKLYEYVLDFAKRSNCYNLTLNVWACNTDAILFYKNMGLIPQKTVMETIL